MGLMDGNTKIEKGLGNTNSEVCSTVKWKRNLHWGKSLLAGRKGRPMQGEFNQLVGYFPNMDAAWLAGHMQEGRILLRLGVFSALNLATNCCIFNNSHNL
jgi:hypothetical protein